MAPSPEIPLPLFFEQSSSFCGSVKTDLDRFIDEIGSSFLSINRNVKVAPKQHRKRGRDVPGSCTLDLNEFKTSKQNVLHKLQTSFEEMELKWSNEIAELKDWFLTKIDTCLSKVQLEIKVSAEDLKLFLPVDEIEFCEEDSSSSLEADKMSPDQSSDLGSVHATNPSGSSSKSGCPQSIETSVGSGSFGDVESIHAESDPPACSKRMGRRGMAGKAQMQKGAKVAPLSEKETCDSNIPNSCIGEPAPKSRKAERQATNTSCGSVPSTNVGTDVLQENTGSLPAASTKMRKNRTAGRAQMKRGAKAAQLNEETVGDSSRPNVCTDEPLHASGSTGNNSCNDLEENVHPFRPAVPSPPPPAANTKRLGRKGATSRAQTKKGVKAALLNVKQTIIDSTIPAETLYAPGSTGNNSCNDPEENMHPFHPAVPSAPPPPVNTKRLGRKGPTSRAQTKKGAKASQLNEKETVSDSSIPNVCTDEPGFQSRVLEIQSISMFTSPFSANVGSDVIQENVDSLHSASTRNMGRTRTAGRVQMKKGGRDIQISKKITSDSSIASSGIDEQVLRSRIPDYQGIKMARASRANVNTDTNDLQGNMDSLHPASFPPSDIKKTSRKGTVRRGQMKKGVWYDQLCEKEIAGDFSILKSIAEPALRSRMSSHQDTDTLFASDPTCNMNTTVLQENIHSNQEASPPPANTEKMGRKGATSRAQKNKGAKGTQLSKKEIASVSTIPNSGIDEPALRSRMSNWQSLLSAVENAPCKPGLYEVKVWRAKKPAYIGLSDDLQKSVSQYREGRPTGEKHLDLFIQRNKDEISVRYEIYPSFQLAKLEQKKRLKEFLEIYKNLPSYNSGL